MPGTAVIALPQRGDSENGGAARLPRALASSKADSPASVRAPIDQSQRRMSQAVARWGDQVAVEWIDGVPFRMYVERPRRLEQLLAFASRWGARPHVVQGERVLTFDDLRRLTAAKTKDLVRLGVGPGDRVA